MAREKGQQVGGWLVGSVGSSKAWAEAEDGVAVYGGQSRSGMKPPYRDCVVEVRGCQAFPKSGLG